MPKTDLVTGFLGSGKTTFIRRYAEYLISRGERVGILENDFGAVNVDMMLLGDMESENCGLEMISGGCCQESAAHRRRFATKLIAMRMDGYDRVIVEPSGIYETDEFFDTLRDDAIESRYEIGNVIALVDAGLEDDLSPAAEYLLASQISCAGAVLVTKSANMPAWRLSKLKARLQAALDKTRCGRIFNDSEFIVNDTDSLTDAVLGFLASCGYRTESCEKTVFDSEHAFDSLFYMRPGISPDKIRDAVKSIFADASCGNVMRIKGFLPSGENSWIELNAMPLSVDVKPVSRGQEIIIVIGEGLDGERIGSYLETP